MDLREAARTQRELAARVEREDRLGEPRLLGGLDCAAPRDPEARIAAAAVVLRREDLAVLEESVVALPAPMAYVPGFLSFRELPALLEAAGRLRLRPDPGWWTGRGSPIPGGWAWRPTSG